MQKWKPRLVRCHCSALLSISGCCGFLKLFCAWHANQVRYFVNFSRGGTFKKPFYVVDIWDQVPKEKDCSLIEFYTRKKFTNSTPTTLIIFNTAQISLDKKYFLSNDKSASLYAVSRWLVFGFDNTKNCWTVSRQLFFWQAKRTDRLMWESLGNIEFHNKINSNNVVIQQQWFDNSEMINVLCGAIFRFLILIELVTHRAQNLNHILGEEWVGCVLKSNLPQPYFVNARVIFRIVDWISRF